VHVRLGVGIRQLPCMQAAARARDQPTRASHGRRQLGSGDRRRGARSARPGPQSPTCAGDRVARRPGRETIERCMGRTRTTETATRGRSMARSRGFPNHCRARQPCVRVAPPRSIPVRFTLQSANKLLPGPADGDPSSTSSSSFFLPSIRPACFDEPHVVLRRRRRRRAISASSTVYCTRKCCRAGHAGR
jgi:hypothetical protein